MMFSLFDIIWLKNNKSLSLIYFDNGNVESCLFGVEWTNTFNDDGQRINTLAFDIFFLGGIIYTIMGLKQYLTKILYKK